MMIMEYLFYILTGFFSGSILYSYLIPKYKKNIDITLSSEDHNPGAANAFHCAGISIGLLATACDVLKGLIPVYFAVRALSVSHPLFSLVLCAPVAGHAFSPMKKGKGGKAIAVSFGVLLALLPAYLHVLVLAAALIGFSLFLVIRPHRARVICAYLVLCFYSLRSTRELSVLVGVLVISAIILWKHGRRDHPDLFSGAFSLLYKDPESRLLSSSFPDRSK